MTMKEPTTLESSGTTRRGVIAGIAAGALAGAGTAVALSGVPDKPIVVAGPHATPEDFGGVGDGISDCTAAFNAAFASGKPLYIPAGDYLIAGRLKEVRDRHLIITGDGPGASRIIFSAEADAGLKVRQHTAAVDIETSHYFHTQISNVGLYTNQQENGVALDIVYSQQVIQFARDEMLVSVDNVHIAGSSPHATGWSGGIRIIDVNHPRIENCHIIGRQPWPPAARGYEQYFIMDFGVYVSVTGDIELNYVRVVGTRIKNVIHGIQCVGAGEGVVVIDCAIPVADYGIFLDKQVASGATDPQVMISNTHINAASRCIYIRQMHEVQITGNLLYSFPHVDTGSWAAFEADTALHALVSGNIIEAFPRDRDDKLVGILGTDLRQSTISGNRYIEIDVPVELTTSRSADNVITGEFRSPPSATGPLVVYSGTAEPSANYSGPKHAKTTETIVLTNRMADVISLSQNLASGAMYELTAVIHGVKGDNAGPIAAEVVNSDGTAVVEFVTVARVGATVDARGESTLSVSALLSASKPGSATLALQASSEESGLTVAAGDASLVLTMR